MFATGVKIVFTEQFLIFFWQRKPAANKVIAAANIAKMIKSITHLLALRTGLKKVIRVKRTRRRE
jgi:hypothetical protein